MGFCKATQDRAEKLNAYIAANEASKAAPNDESLRGKMLAAREIVDREKIGC